jgi:DNA primase
MEHDGLTFMEAVKRLADAANIRIEDEVWDANAEQAAKLRANMIRAHKELAAWYHQLLMKHQMAADARQYLKSRGITAEVAKSWQIGYAPPASPPLRQWAAQHKFGQQLLVDAGILGQSEETGEVYPRFRHRLMFPIRSDNGDVIAFSGRLLDPQAKTAKYLNTSETMLFNKSKVLFGLDKSKRAISKASQAIVCEGQIDTLMLFEAGFQNVVAGQGTAFTEFHARKLKILTDEVVLCYDSDSAGYAAAEKAFRVLAPIGLIVKVAALPPGEDPDSLLRKQGKEAVSAVLSGAKDFIDYQVENVGSRKNLDEMSERVRFAEEMATNIRLLESQVARETAAQRVAMRLGIPEATMQKIIKKAPAAYGGKKTAEKALERPGQELLDSQNKTANTLCQMAIADAQVLTWLRDSGRQEILRDLAGTELLALVWRGKYDPVDPSAFSAFLSGLDRNQEAALTQLMFQPPPPGGLESAAHALQVLDIERMQLLKQKLETQLKHPNISAEDAAAIQQEHIEAHRELLSLQRALNSPGPSGHS